MFLNRRKRVQFRYIKNLISRFALHVFYVKNAVSCMLSYMVQYIQ